VTDTQGGWRSDEEFGRLPPEYEPVHHEPRRPQSRRPDPRHDPRDARPWAPPAYGQPQQPYQPGQPYYPAPPNAPHPSGPQPMQQPPQQPQWQQPPQWQQQPQQQPQWEPQPQWQEPPRPSFEPNSGYEGGQGFMPGFTDGDGHGYDDNGYAESYEDYEEPPAPGGPGRKQKPPRKRRSKIRILAPWIAILVILIPIAYGGYYAYSLYQDKYHPADYAGDGTGSVQVEVKPGDSASSLAPELLSLGVVASTRAFINAAEKVTTGPGMEPGFYRLHEHMSAAAAYAVLSNPKNIIEVKAIIPEGLRASQIIAVLSKADPALTLSSYQQALKNPKLGLPSYAGGKAEGYLFPAEYQIQPNATALSVLQQMVSRYNQEAASINLTTAVAARVGLKNPAQVIVVASLLQAEGGKDSDFPKIARVIYNRLAAGMPLQFDSTVCYGLGKFCTRATDADLASTSPYNTYKYKGLPPGPIDSPGDAAIQAALHPATGAWLYFVTVNPKTHLTEFADTYPQFLQLQQELNRNTGQG
jgi:peptidoglycan lytic transglycosylase G